MQPRYRPELPRNKWPNPDEQRRLIHCGSLSQVVSTNSAASIVEAVITSATVYVGVMTALGQTEKNSTRQDDLVDGHRRFEPGSARRRSALECE
jgi:hypothetical protein